MRILILTGPLYPHRGNNANLIGKLIPSLLSYGNEVHILSTVFSVYTDEPPEVYFGVPIHWVSDQKMDWKRRYVYPAFSKMLDPNGYSDALQSMIVYRGIKDVYKKYRFDILFSTIEPYAMAVAAVRYSSIRKILYLMDPPAIVSNGEKTLFRIRTLPLILKRQDSILTTPFIKEALLSHGYLRSDDKVKTVGFPMIGQAIPTKRTFDNGKIKLLFCGWLYSSIRSPQYFLKIVSQLDKRFEVTFMGKECDNLWRRYPVTTNASLITLPYQPYEVALQAMADADILINIGNSVPVHMPSKTLEYINTGKPIVNFYKIKDCPTLYYTQRYPLALNLFEKDNDIRTVSERFIRFCENNKGVTVERTIIEHEFADCTPTFIAQKVIDSLGLT